MKEPHYPSTVAKPKMIFFPALALGVLIGLGTVACSSDQEPKNPKSGPSAECERAIVEVDKQVFEVPSVFNPVLRDSLNICSTAEEWLAAARLHPRAAGADTPEHVNPKLLTLGFCGRPLNLSTKICVAVNGADWGKTSKP